MRIGDANLRDGKISTDRPKKLSKVQTDGDEPAAPARAAEGPSPFACILHGLGREVDRGETLVRRAVSGSYGGKELGNLELLSLQAGVYRYSEAVDLSAKLVDRAASGVKTVLQGQ
jgi:hypothetical protein